MRLQRSSRLALAIVGALLVSTVANFSVAGAVTPTCSMLLPSSGAKVRQGIVVDANATNAASVSFYLDGAYLGPAYPTLYGYLYSLDGGATWTWDSTHVGDGSHNLSCKAVASDGTTAQSANLPFVVDNTAPTASVLSPSANATVSGGFPFVASASDGGSGLSGVKFSLDGSLLGAATNGAFGWALGWNTACFANGSHTVTATATDVAGNSFTTPSVSFTASNAATIVAQENGKASQWTPCPNVPILNSTSTVYAVGGADNGVMWDDGAGHTLEFFGDTFGFAWTGPGGTGNDWRSNTLAISSDTNLADGMTLSGMVTDTSGHAKELIASSHGAGGEVTKIPLGGISVGSRQIVSYLSVHQWGPLQTNYAAMAYSDDDGQTWTTASNAIWNNNGSYTDPFQGGALAKDGTYVYYFGEPNGLLGPVYLARVTFANVLSKSSYEYWNGSSWQLNNESAAVPIVGSAGSVREISVLYNATAGKWRLLTCNDSNGTVELREATSLTGSWSSPRALLTYSSSSTPGNAYGTFISPLSTATDLYFNLSFWNPYAVYLVHASL